MNDQRISNRTLALAGVFQAAQLVRETASSGREITPAVIASVHSIFQIDAGGVEEIYGGVPSLRTGLKTLSVQLDPGRNPKRDLDVGRYVISLLFLERKLHKRPDLLEHLRQGIQAATNQALYFSETHPNVIARLADLYSETVSTLTPRIMVSGEQAILTNPDNANLVRALLLAGVRSAVLWRQLGGRRWQLLLMRKSTVSLATDLLRLA